MATNSLALAVKHHQAGNLGEAEQLCRQVLQTEPANAEAWQVLGVVLQTQGRLEEAVAGYRQALQYNPNFVEAHSNLGMALSALKRLDQAVVHFQQALRLKPDFADGYLNLGGAMLKQGQLQGAAVCFRQALLLKPDNVSAHNHLGVALAMQGKVAEAEACYREAGRLKPDSVDAHYNLGIALAEQKKTEEAVASFQRALQLNPRHAESHNNLGLALRDLGRFDEAVASLQQALQFRPNHAETYNNLGTVLAKQEKHLEAAGYYQHAIKLRPNFAGAHYNLGISLAVLRRLQEAVAYIHEAIRLQPNFPEAYNNLGNSLRDMGQYEAAYAAFQESLRLNPNSAEAHNNLGAEYAVQGKLNEAIASYQRAVQLKPDYAGAYSNLGAALMDKGDLDEAVTAFRKSLAINPDYVEAQNNLAQTLLYMGNFKEGWQVYEWRWKRTDTYMRSYPQPWWDGSSLQGRTILLHAEQGLGDTLMFIRFAPLVKERGARVIVECQKPLLRILARCPGIDQLVEREADLPPFDVHAPLMSLPRLFGVGLDNIPANIPYLHADPALVEHWRQELSSVPGFRIGIVWKGNPHYQRNPNRFRSVPLACFAPLATLEGVRLFGLQKGPGIEQIKEVADRFTVIDLGSKMDETSGPFMDTAAVMKNLDLIISADTAIPHLAGGLGVPIWIALPVGCEWRWLVGREDTPWYPNMRLFRQKRQGDWDEVFTRITAEVQKLLAATPRSGSASAPAKVNESMAALLTRARNELQAGNAPALASICRQLLDADPSQAEAWLLLGRMSRGLGKQADAIVHYDEALRLKPDYFLAHLSRGIALRELGQTDAAIASYQEALRLAPNSPEALSSLGSALCDKGLYEEAVSALERAVQLKPDLVGANNNLGVIHTHQGQLVKAVANLEQALRLDPHHADAHTNLGAALVKLGRHDAALPHFRESIRLKPDHAETHNHLGAELLARGQFAEAETSFLEALRLNPDHARVHGNLGILLSQRGEVNEAIVHFEKAIRLEPSNADFHLNLAVTLLSMGEWARAWPEFEWRLRDSRLGLQRDFRQPRWDGSELGQRTLLLHAEGGFGDALQLVRYVPLVAQRGGRIILECPAEVKHLLQRSVGSVEVVARGEELPDFDVQAPLPSLPLVFGTTLETVPATIPYLILDPERVAFWRQRLKADGDHLKVGLVWSGKPKRMRRNQSNTTLDQFRSLAGVREARFYSLQKGEAAGQAQQPPAGLSLTDWTAELKDFDDTAALIANLDLVISVDTSIAHLAGALGKPVWTLLVSWPDFRWLLQREDSPWYPTMRLFRQKEPGDWDEVFERITIEIKKLLEKPAKVKKKATARKKRR